MTNLLIVGPPGAGKGTQAVRIAERYGIPAISTGDIFRANIKDQTTLGKKVSEILDRGELVPDSLTNDLIADRLHQEDAREGYLLDGYPRTTGQVEFLDGVNTERGQQIDAVVRLVADKEEVVRRLRKRAEEQGRSDDNAETIRHRLDVYERETAPLIELFASRGLIVEVDGLGEIDEVTERVLTALAERGLK
ncbi:adenylate kinase [Agrococcus casei]|uniref:Adenylate kinase n=1 Tax=Agrococcus casei LMG 22410 TaxID=1255656 RepID=A0A1R4FB61_9MICO|nr:adenylate kinase [Agrococcus casei]SJM53116.1 Adenylate kinase [Agrococcus casei LMG 22410]